jgi:hypothetical protein
VTENGQKNVSEGVIKVRVNEREERGIFEKLTGINDAGPLVALYLRRPNSREPQEDVIPKNEGDQKNCMPGACIQFLAKATE